MYKFEFFIPYLETFLCEGCHRLIGAESPFVRFMKGDIDVQISRALDIITVCPHCGHKNELFLSLHNN